MLELGCSPGGWTQVAVEMTKSSEYKPTVFSIDSEFMDPIDGSCFYQGNVNDPKT